MKFLKSVGVFIALVFICVMVLVAFSGQSFGPSRYQAYKPDIKYLQTKNDVNAKFDAIIRLKREDGSSFCTGFVIDGEYAITAAHCVADMDKDTNIKIFDRKNIDTNTVATVLGFNHRNDTAILAGDFTRFRRLAIEKDKNGFYEHPNSMYHICGYPYGQKFLYCSQGKVVEPSNFGMRLIGAGVPGMSGGPVINTDTGKAVGLNSYVDGPYFVSFPLTGILGSFGLE